ncbi:MAG: N-acetyltransferase [Bacteroidetes bacterium]|nr:MAG: N-acetyltransferase [Bacteroidota bacterium]
MIFETKRLCIRPLEPADFEGFHEMQSDPEVMKYTTGKPFSEAENRKQLADVIARYTAPGNSFWVWAVVQKSNGAFVGTCAAIGEPDGAVEIGYRIRRCMWGQGYGSEICRGLIDYCLHVRHWTHLHAVADVRNVPSVRILEKSRLNFEKEAPNEMGGTDRFYRLKEEVLNKKQA